MPEVRKRTRRTQSRLDLKPAVMVAPRRPLWPFVLALFVVLYVAFQVYAPVLHGPFLFDDSYLPFNAPNYPSVLRAWIGGVRPLLMFSYWINFRTSGLDTFPYHLLNVIFHAMNALLTFLIVRKLLDFAGVDAVKRDLLAAFGGALFLLHPVQTESVAYVASRSESLSVLFFLAAYALFLYRSGPEISLGRSLVVVLLFGAALGTKEHTVVLPALLVLTDYFWNPGFSLQGIRRNWRLYGIIALCGVLGVFFLRNILLRSQSAGFGLKDFTWYQYFFTQCRALFVYIRLFFFPAGQTVDYDFAISRTLFEHGAIFGLLALIGLAAAAWLGRRKYPLAAFGFFAYLVLMAPTSSILPIRDPVAERRLYLSMLGLLLVVMEALRRVSIDRKKLAGALAVLLAIAGILSYQRNRVWGSAIALWEDTVQKSPGKSRVHFQLAYAYFEAGRCDRAVTEYERVAQLEPATYELLIDWAQAYDCLQKWDQAVEKLNRALIIERNALAQSMIGMVYAKQARWLEALAALDIAEKIDPNYAMTFYYRGGVYAARNELQHAAASYQRAQALDPSNEPARQGLAAVMERMRHSR